MKMNEHFSTKRRKFLKNWPKKWGGRAPPGHKGAAGHALCRYDPAFISGLTKYYLHAQKYNDYGRSGEFS